MSIAENTMNEEDARLVIRNLAGQTINHNITGDERQRVLESTIEKLTTHVTGNPEQTVMSHTMYRVGADGSYENMQMTGMETAEQVAELNADHWVEKHQTSLIPSMADLGYGHLENGNIKGGTTSLTTSEYQALFEKDENGITRASRMTDSELSSAMPSA